MKLNYTHCSTHLNIILDMAPECNIQLNSSSNLYLTIQCYGYTIIYPTTQLGRVVELSDCFPGYFPFPIQILQLIFVHDPLWTDGQIPKSEIAKSKGVKNYTEVFLNLIFSSNKKLMNSHLSII